MTSMMRSPPRSPGDKIAFPLTYRAPRSVLLRGRVRPRAFALVAALVALLVSGAGQTSAGAATDRYTPLIQQVHSTPRWFTGADDRTHLVYELELTNGFPVPSP